jgi:amino acid transporter
VTGLAVLELLCGVLTAISIFPSCIIGGILQILASIVVLAIEAPMFVSFLSFAAPITAFWEGKPIWMRAACYLALAIIPGLAGCFGLFYILGFLSAVCVAAIYALSILGPKASRDDMRVAAGGGDAYSPTMSP